MRASPSKIRLPVTVDVSLFRTTGAEVAALSPGALRTDAGSVRFGARGCDRRGEAIQRPDVPADIGADAAAWKNCTTNAEYRSPLLVGRTANQ